MQAFLVDEDSEVPAQLVNDDLSAQDWEIFVPGLADKKFGI